MKKLLLGIAMSLSAIQMGAYAQDPGSQLLITAKLEGGQEVPSVETDAGGIAALTLNSTRDTVFVNIGFHSLSSAPTGIQLYDGRAGRTGTPLIDLQQWLHGNRVIGRITGEDLTSAFIGKLLNGGLYINVTTQANAAGEIRGQLYLEKDFGLHALLHPAPIAAPETANILPSGRALGIFKVSKDSTDIKINVVAQGLSGAIIEANFYAGNPGAGGLLIKDLSPLIIEGNSLYGAVIDTNKRYVKDLLSGNIYLNIHTDLFPDGEVWGQVILDTANLVFDVRADASNITPAIAATAKGAALIRISPTLDTLRFDALFNRLTGSLIGVYLREVTAQTIVVADFGTGTPSSGNRALMDSAASGYITGTTIEGDPIISNTLLNKLLTGNANLFGHTVANQTGELSGKLLRQPRIGLTSVINGSQVNPTPSISPATGAAYVSLDRDWTELSWAAVVSNLTGPITGAHFHSGMKGQTGPEIYTLTDSFMRTSTVDQASGFIKSTSTPPLTLLNASRFVKDSMYLDIHTSTNTNGEIRGQILKNGKAEEIIVTAVSDADLSMEDFKMAPNPTSGIVKMSLASRNQNGVKISVTDLTGTELLTNSLDMANVSSHELDLTSLNNGMYFVVIQNGNNKVIKKVVKY